MSHNVCCVNFGGKKYRLPRYSIGDQVLYRGRTYLVNGVHSFPCGEVIYHLESGDGSLPCELYEYELLSLGNVPSKKLESYCGFRVGDTVVDTESSLGLISIVVGFDYKRRLVKIKTKSSRFKLTYIVSPSDLKFVNPVTLRMSYERKVLDEK